MGIYVNDVEKLANQLRNYYDDYKPKPIGLFYAAFDLGIELCEEGESLETILKMANIPVSYTIELRRALLQVEYIRDRINKCNSLSELKEKYNI